VRGSTGGKRGWRKGSGSSFVICEEGSGEVVGWIGARLVDEEAAQIGYAVDPDARSRGVATAALRLLVEWLFRETPCERLQLLTHLDNRASERVAEKTGFRAEGVLRSYFVQRGERHDVTMHALLRSDLEAGDRSARQ
jgi:RimJ/RimL family protein N-acetyltransferase